MTVRSGAEALVAAAEAAQIEVCFTNPGTTEMPIIAAMDKASQMHPILVLFEGVAAGAADAYARVTGRPAMTVLHLGAGLGNAVANLHNAKRARTPVLNVVGDQATWHSPFESMLACDIESLARPISRLVRRVASAEHVVSDVFEGVRAALGRPGGVATLIVPHDCQWNPSPDVPYPDRPRPMNDPIDHDAITAATRAVRAGKETVLYLGGQALNGRGLRAALGIQIATGCRVLTETFTAKLERGRGIPSFSPLPYFPEAAVAALADSKTLVTAGADAPLTVFATPDTPQPEVKAPHTDHIVLASPGADAEAALEAVHEQLGGSTPSVEERTPVVPSDGQALTPVAIAETLAALLPERAIVVDEASTSGYAFQRALPFAPPHTALGLTGGAIGMGLPAGVGAAVAAPGHRIVVLQADGSGMYTPQALWTMAREGLDITVLILANRRYNILQIELKRAGLDQLGRHTSKLTTLTQPEIDWVSLARGLGVAASQVTELSHLAGAIESSFATPGPQLIEILL